MIKLDIKLQNNSFPKIENEYIDLYSSVESINKILTLWSQEVKCISLYSGLTEFSAQNISSFLELCINCDELDLSYNEWIDDIFLMKLSETLQFSKLKKLRLHMLPKITYKGIIALRSLQTIETVQATSCIRISKIMEEVPFKLIVNEWIGY